MEEKPETPQTTQATPKQSETTPPPETTPSKLSKSKKLRLLGFALLVIVFLIFTSLLAFRNKNLKQQISQIKPQPTLTPMPTDDLVNWKTYTNTPLGLSFKYPASWEDAETDLLSTKTLIRINDGLESTVSTNRLEITKGTNYSQVLTRNLTLQEIIDQRGLANISPEEKEKSRLSQEDFKLGHYNGTKFTYHSHGVGHFNTEIFLAESLSSTEILTIVYRHNMSESNSEAPIPHTLNQILSTFKFMD